MEVVDDEEGSVRVVAAEVIPTKTKLGPYEAKKTTQVIEAEDGFILRVSAMFLQAYFYRLQTKFAKVMFLHVSVILSTGGGGVVDPSMPCSRSRGGGGIPACLAGFQAHTQGGS